MIIHIRKSSIVESIEIIEGRDICVFMVLTKNARIECNINFETMGTIIQDNARMGEGESVLSKIGISKCSTVGAGRVVT